jgi:MinD-like ATPase involved in chromosome partitioning or flagellar assembly
MRHIWCVGKTGTGKSTMIANMVIDDFKKGRGVAVIDPHGDLCDDLLDYIPKSRINDTIYFNPPIATSELF